MAIVCLHLSQFASNLFGQDSYSLRDSWQSRASRFGVYDLYQEELAQFRELQPFFYLSNQGEVVEAKPLAQDPVNQEQVVEELEANSDFDVGEPGEVLFGGVRHWFRNTPFFGHGVTAVDDPRRHWGVGIPLEGTSWRNRPWHVGVFAGMLDGGVVANGDVLQDSGLFWGVRVGNDFDHYWGWELRVGTAKIDLTRHDTGVPLAQDGRNTYYDLNVLYYPFGDTRWRPYLSLGLGAATHGFADLQGNSFDETTAIMPLGLGVKYFVRPGASIRAEFTNNFSFGTQNSSGTDNISLTMGFDWHFGGHRRVYYPWDASIQVW